MKSLSVAPSTIDFGNQAVGNKRSKSVLITNTGTENCELTGIATKGAFSSDLHAKTIPPAYPVSSTLYLVNINGKKVLQNIDGSFQTTDLGYGIAGTTDSDGKLTLNFALPVISITSPLTGKFELETNQTLNWTSSNVSLVDITITGTLGGSKVYSGITASLGTYTFQLNSADGFVVNDTFEIEISACVGATSDTVTGLGTIATIANDAIGSQVDGVAFDVDGDSNGSEVEISHRLASSTGAWTSDGTATVVLGRYTKSVTITGAETYDIKVEDTTDTDGNAQQNDVEVASGQTAILTLDATCLASAVEDVEINADTLTADATCVASAPTDV